jgi:hypothetical protein
MRATVVYGGGVLVERVSDALIPATGAGIWGSDLWPYNRIPRCESGLITARELERRL